MGFAPDLLLVDMAWPSLHYILLLPGVESWLFLRSCAPEFLSGQLAPGFRISFDSRLYTRVIGIEPIAPSFLDDRIHPIVVCNRDECLPKAALRELFGVDPGVPITLVVQAGDRGECDELLWLENARNDNQAVVAASLHGSGPIFPIAPFLPGANPFVGGAGYYLFWETRWLGVDSSELYAMERGGDDQAYDSELLGTRCL